MGAKTFEYHVKFNENAIQAVWELIELVNESENQHVNEQINKIVKEMLDKINSKW